MKYFTKEFYRIDRLRQALSFLDIIEDGDYGEEEIKEFYKDQEASFIELVTEANDKSPVEIQEEFLREKGLGLEDIFIWDLDEEGNRVDERNPKDLDELRTYLEKDLEEEMADYNNREELDQDLLREYFKEDFEYSLDMVKKDLPDQLMQGTDPRLLALGYIPQETYDRLEEYIEDEEEIQDEKFEVYMEEIEEELENIPESIIDPFFLEDTIIYKIEKTDQGHISMGLIGDDMGGGLVDRIFVFKNAEFIEREDFDPSLEEPGIIKNLEVHRGEKGYELHLLVEKYMEYYYVTIAFEAYMYDDEDID